MTSLELPALPAPDAGAAAAAAARLDNLTKPRGSLGRLEELAIRLASIQARPLPRIERKVAVVVAADHGVAAQGVSAYPQEVTAQMVANFLAGKAAINVLAAWAGADLLIVDAGVRRRIDADPRVLSLRIAPGTRDFSREPAMTREQAEQALNAGIELGRSGIDADAVACGEMGIGNSTSASAVTAALLGLSGRSVAGAGTGIGPEGVARKAEVIDAALRLHRPDRDDALDVLTKVGGFEIAVLAGLMAGAASRRRVVVLDGLISSAAALIAVRLAPDPSTGSGQALRPFLIASHLSSEPAQRWILEDLGLRPLLDLDLRLGEGTGAVLALPLLDAACRILAGMATFDEAGVSGRGDTGAEAVE